MAESVAIEEWLLQTFRSLQTISARKMAQVIEEALVVNPQKRKAEDQDSPSVSQTERFSSLGAKVTTAQLFCLQAGGRVFPINGQVKMLGFVTDCKEHKATLSYDHRTSDKRSLSLDDFKVAEPGMSSQRQINGTLKPLWSFDLGECVDSSPMALVSSQGPLCELLFIGSHSGVFSCLCIQCGACVWRAQLNDRVEGSASLSRDGSRLVLLYLGSSSSYTLNSCCHSVLVGCSDGTLFALDSSTGQARFTFHAQGSDQERAVGFEKPRTDCIGSYDLFLYALSEQGQLLWRVAVQSAVGASPVANQLEEHVLVAALGGSCFCIAVEAGQVLWKINLGSPIFSSPILFGAEQALLLTVKAEVLKVQLRDGSYQHMATPQAPDLLSYSQLVKLSERQSYLVPNVWALLCFTRASSSLVFRVSPWAHRLHNGQAGKVFWLRPPTTANSSG